MNRPDDLGRPDRPDIDTAPDALARYQYCRAVNGRHPFVGDACIECGLPWALWGMFELCGAAIGHEYYGASFCVHCGKLPQYPGVTK